MDIEKKGKELGRDAGKMVENVVNATAEKAAQAQKAVSEQASEAQKAVSEGVDKLDKEARQMVSTARDETQNLVEGAERCIRKNPLEHVMLAGFVGLLIGLIIRK